MNLVPIKVIIRLKTDGSALYPAFNNLPTVMASGQDWSIYVDSQGSGWLYDCCGHKEIETDSPIGMQFGMLLVPEAFATQAVATFPGEVTLLTRAEAADFYDNRHASKFQDEEIDRHIVKAIRLKQDLGLELTPNQTSALDPTTDTPGIRANYRKNFSTYRAKRGITLRS